MDVVMMIACGALAAVGMLLLADFLLWESRGVKAVAQIEGFRGQTDKGARLPVVSFDDAEGQNVKAGADRIDQLMYLLSRPQPGDVTPVIYRIEAGAMKVRVYGYLNAGAGVVLIMPLIVMLGLVFERELLAAQGTFFLIFLVFMIGGVALLKLVQRSY